MYPRCWSTGERACQAFLSPTITIQAKQELNEFFILCAEVRLSVPHLGDYL